MENFILATQFSTYLQHCQWWRLKELCLIYRVVKNRLVVPGYRFTTSKRCFYSQWMTSTVCLAWGVNTSIMDYDWLKCLWQKMSMSLNPIRIFISCTRKNPKIKFLFKLSHLQPPLIHLYFFISLIVITCIWRLVLKIYTCTYNCMSIFRYVFVSSILSGLIFWI